jgi:DNA-binding transcriptional regulator YiaG
MSKATTYKSDALAAVHETASDMFEAGVIDKQTMRHFDESCLTTIHQFSAEEIKALRERDKGIGQSMGTRTKETVTAKVSSSPFFFESFGTRI